MQKKQKKEWKKPEVVDLDGYKTNYYSTGSDADGDIGYSPIS